MTQASHRSTSTLNAKFGADCGATLPVTKLHGAQNDFLFLSRSSLPQACSLEDLRALACRLCHRFKGLGADGLVVWDRSVPTAPGVKPSRLGTAFFALIINSDGTFAGTCGNALRCLGLLAIREGLWHGDTPVPVMRPDLEQWGIAKTPVLTGSDADKFSARNASRDSSKDPKCGSDEPFLETPGEVFATLLFATLPEASPRNGRLEGTFSQHPEGCQVTVSMGREKSVVVQPEFAFVPFSPEHSSSAVEGSQRLAFFAALARRAKTAFVTLSNPHWVFFDPAFSHFTQRDFEDFGRLAQSEDWRKLENLPVANIGMLSATQPEGSLKDTAIDIGTTRVSDTWKLTVYERGAGLTACCGSGATAARVALEALGMVECQLPGVTFVMPGGQVSVGWWPFPTQCVTEGVTEGVTETVAERTGERTLTGPAQWIAHCAVACGETFFPTLIPTL